MFRTGSFKAEIQTSDDGQQFTKIADITGNKGELVKTAIFTPVQYVRILNTATGSTHIHGIKLFAPDNGETPGPETAIEHNDILPKAEKLFINGQIVIRKDGKLYSITGMLLHE